MRFPRYTSPNQPNRLCLTCRLAWHGGPASQCWDCGGPGEEQTIVIYPGPSWNWGYQHTDEPLPWQIREGKTTT